MMHIPHKFRIFADVGKFAHIFMTAAVLLALSGMKATAQEVTFSRQIPGLRPYSIDEQVMTRTEKDSVRMVMELWRRYVSSFTSPLFTEGRRREMWVDGSEDYLQEFDDGNLLYATFRENRVLDIRKLGAGTYEIVAMTRSRLPGEYADWIESVFRVCAMAVADKPGTMQNPFRLCNWLDAVLPTLKKQRVGNLLYYASSDVPRKDARRVSSFIDRFRAAYGLPTGAPVRYVVGTSAEDCRLLSGFLFNAYSNLRTTTAAPRAMGTGFYGRTFGSGLVLSNYLDDSHDIILSLILPEYSRALPLLTEGVALYHGGFMTCSYDVLKSSLRRYLAANRDLDLSVEEDLYGRSVPVLAGETLGPSVPLEGLVGAVLVEYAFTRHGVWKVKELLACGEYARLFRCLGIPSGDIDIFLRGIL